MPLKSRDAFPPGGFPYREAALHWSPPDPKQPFNLIAAQIQAVRLANPWAGLNPSFDACQADLDAYNTERLSNNPKWCWPTESAVALAAERARQAPGCAACGKGKRKT